MNMTKEQSDRVMKWVGQHWKCCPHCNASPGWMIAGRCYLPSDWHHPDPRSASGAPLHVDVVALTCQGCQGLSFLNAMVAGKS